MKQPLSLTDVQPRESRLKAALLAFALTVSILGSLGYLAFRRLEESQEEARVRAFVEGLTFRSQAELHEGVEFLLERPALARRVLPVVVQRARRAELPATTRLAAVRVAREFVRREPRIARALFRLRESPDEYVASEAVLALGEVQPPEDAAELLGQCLTGNVSPSVVDAACDRLIRLGLPGRQALAARIDRLSAERRAWIMGLVSDRGLSDASAWVQLLLSAPESAAPPAGASSNLNAGIRPS